MKKRIKNLNKFYKIDKIVSFGEKTPIKLIKKINPDVIVKGGDYTINQVVGKDTSKILIFPLLKGFSSSKIITKFSN